MPGQSPRVAGTGAPVCVPLIQGTRKKPFSSEIARLSNSSLEVEDDAVQEGLGWLLPEAAKADRQRRVAYLMKIRARATRLVLPTACETLPAAMRKRILTQ